MMVMMIVEMMDAVGVGRKCAGMRVCGLEERLCGQAAMQDGCFVALCTLCGLL